MIEHHSITNAALAVGVATITVRRWIESGALVWPKPFRKHPVTLEVLREVKLRVMEGKTSKLKERLRKRRKYFTDEERAMAAYQAVKRFRHANQAKVSALDKQSRALLHHPCFQVMREELLAFYGKRCLRCRQRNANCLDHVRPLSLNGENHPCNLQPLCRQCNSAKSDQSTDYRHDKGRWLAIRWGGWVVNGQDSAIQHRRGRRKHSELRLRPGETKRREVDEREGLGSGESAFTIRHWLAVEDWRTPRIHAGAHCDPASYKSFVAGPQNIHTQYVTDGVISNASTAQ